MTANRTLTSVAGVRVGHWADSNAVTGVTVMIFPEPNVAAVELRGAAPGTREVGLLAPGMKVETIQALVFGGGSAFGLAAADGVVRELESEGRGHPTMAGPVPIVPAAILYDLMVGDGSVRPGPADGAAAYRAATDDPVAEGSVGAGTGAVVAGWRGFENVRKGGLGSSATTVDSAVVAALVVANATGDVFTPDGASLTGGPSLPDGGPAMTRPLEHTTLVAVATDAALSRTDLMRFTVRAHDALALCLRPAHTRYDGDVVFAISCGSMAADVDALGEAVFRVVAESVVRGVRSATSLGGVPTVGGETNP
ncbi:MAG: P1 family peptidase [Acidimicrobiia bacterium]